VVFAVGGIAGQLLGGLFFDHLSWRWAFFVNFPLAALVMVVVGVNLQVPYRRAAHAIDYLARRCSPARWRASWSS